MAWAVAALGVEGECAIDHLDQVKISYPGFWQTLGPIGVLTVTAATATERFFLIGFMGTGKTTLGRRWRSGWDSRSSTSTSASSGRAE